MILESTNEKVAQWAQNTKDPVIAAGLNVHFSSMPSALYISFRRRKTAAEEIHAGDHLQHIRSLLPTIKWYESQPKIHDYCTDQSDPGRGMRTRRLWAVTKAVSRPDSRLLPSQRSSAILRTLHNLKFLHNERPSHHQQQPHSQRPFRSRLTVKVVSHLL